MMIIMTTMMMIMIDDDDDDDDDDIDISLTLDETTPGGNPDDNTANTEWSLTTNPANTVAIGRVSSPTSANGNSVAELFDVDIDEGADGVAPANIAKTFNFTLKDHNGNALPNGSATGVQTTLVVTEVGGGSPLDALSSANRTIWLYKVSDTEIIGKIGHDTATTADDYIALRITLSGSATDPQFTVEQYLPIRHPDAGSSASDHDDDVSLYLQDDDASLGITMNVSVVDGDGDGDFEFPHHHNY